MSQRKKDDDKTIELEQESVEIEEFDEFDDVGSLFLGRSTEGAIGFDLNSELESRIATRLPSTIQ